MNLTLLQIADGLNNYADRVIDEQDELELVTPDGEVILAGPALKEKLDGYGYRLATCLMIARTQAAIAEDAKKKADQAKNAVEGMEARLKAYMDITGTEELRVGNIDDPKAAVFDYTNFINPRSVSTVVDISAEDLPERFQRIKIEADKTAIKDALKRGEVVEGCHISEPARTLKREVAR